MKKILIFISFALLFNNVNLMAEVNNETFGSVAVESDCSTGTLTATAN